MSIFAIFAVVADYLLVSALDWIKYILSLELCINIIFSLNGLNVGIFVLPLLLDILAHLLLLPLQFNGVALVVHEVHLVLILIRAIGFHLLLDITTFFYFLVNAFNSFHLGVKLVPAIQV